MTDRHVIPAEDGWHVEKEHGKRPSAKTATQAEAISRASQIVANEGGGRVVIHGTDGQERETRTVTGATATDTDTESAIRPAEDAAEHDAVQHDAVQSDQHGHTGHHHSDSVGNGSGDHRKGRHAAHHAAHRNLLHLDLPLVGSVTLPPPDQLAYLGGITALVAVGILEWPIAALLGAGHVLAATRNSKILADFGEALEEA